jgi:diaminobutyrate-2-oxoglutarate transaminase
MPNLRAAYPCLPKEDHVVTDIQVFEVHESQVRNYCRHWPTVFSRAKGSLVYDEHDRSYLDFFAGAGALNYGHNHPHLKEALLSYLSEDSIVHSLDMYTVAKAKFLNELQDIILYPRKLSYKAQFPGPAGTTAVEAALKLARRYTGRSAIVSFTNAFHGMTLGALALTVTSSNLYSAPSADTIVLPYDHEAGGESTGLQLLERLLADNSRNRPAAAIVETVQGEGGLRAASVSWLRRLASLCQNHGVLLIVDDVQMGCGRTGPFFSFEPSGIHPDMVCLSKSLSGYGLPLALTLLRPELDVWAIGEHSGTFRGINPAFVTATAALDFWRTSTLERETLDKGQLIESTLNEIARRHDSAVSEIRGRGLARGIAFHERERASNICESAFNHGLLVETTGKNHEVVKIMPPVTIAIEDLLRGLDILRDAIDKSAAEQ